MSENRKINTVGLITYHYPHLKTEQVLSRLFTSEQKFEFKMYALPYVARKPRKVLFQHRPEQANATAPEELARKYKISYVKCESDTSIDNSCDIYLVLGAGILSSGCVSGKRIINCHPGIIPANRGLDSFKWAIYEMKPLGVTLHFIDEQVDAGEIISVIPTKVNSSDNIETLAKRHYENEIDALSRFNDLLKKPQTKTLDVEKGEPKKRMSFEDERELAKKFPEYCRRFGSN